MLLRSSKGFTPNPRKCAPLRGPGACCSPKEATQCKKTDVHGCSQSWMINTCSVSRLSTTSVKFRYTREGRVREWSSQPLPPTWILSTGPTTAHATSPASIARTRSYLAILSLNIRPLTPAHSPPDASIRCQVKASRAWGSKPG